ncbi:MAG: hypothetical protein HW405_814 [Candidatus Berkelbacteria bacterium]|nr:hypothetical protein [Candidatus Berkelbacteria bacterium]
MKIEMKKFGAILNSRPDGREAALRLFQIVNGTDEKKVTIDLDGVVVLTPSFADEFFTLINERYAGQKELEVVNANTPVVKSSLQVLKK